MGPIEHHSVTATLNAQVRAKGDHMPLRIGLVRPERPGELAVEVTIDIDHGSVGVIVRIDGKEYTGQGDVNALRVLLGGPTGLESESQATGRVIHDLTRRVSTKWEPLSF